MDVWEIERTSSTMFRVRAESEEEAERFADIINSVVGTLMIDTSNWRFKELDERLDIDDVEIVEIYSEVD